MSEPAPLEVRPPADDAECRALADLFRVAFASFGRPPEFAEQCVEHIGRENSRVALRGTQLVAGLGIFHFRQWFGGKSISSSGITVVAVAPEARGGGVGTELMRTVVRQLHAQGATLSALYPSTYPIYRNAGYEPAGEHHVLEFEARSLGMQDRELRMRPASDGDLETLRDLHRAYARRNNGNLERTHREWARILEFATEPVRTYVVESPRGRGLEGYVVYTQHHPVDPPYEIKIRDLAFVTAGAGRRLLTFLADHSTMARHISYCGALRDPLLALARFEQVKVRARQYWMLRVVDVPTALHERGYPPGVAAELHFEIEDDLIPQNNGRFVLEVRDTVGRIHRGGSGRIKVGVRGLAPLFTGHFSASQLMLAGMLEGEDADLAQASAVFAGPSPWMIDGF